MRHGVIPAEGPLATRSDTERRVLSAVQQAGALPGAEIARRTGLSAQSASVITRALEAQALLRRGQPTRGKVGKPSVPISLNPEGVFAFGLKIGRRQSDLVLLDFAGMVQGRKTVGHDYPTPRATMAFLQAGMSELAGELAPSLRERICGVGIGVPFEIWNWLDLVGAPRETMIAWRGFSFADAIGQFSDLPVAVANDTTLACAAEQVFGVGQELANFAYFFIGTFIGGGVVHDGRIWTGPTGNAGAFGSIPIGDTARPNHQLIHNASLFDLEQRLEASGASGARMRSDPALLERSAGVVSDWIADSARAIAAASVAVVSVLDTDAVVIDCALSADIRDRLVNATRLSIGAIDRQGIRTPAVLAGCIGRPAGAIGAAYLPIAARYLLSGTDFAAVPARAVCP